MEWGQSKIASYSESSLSAVAIVWWASSILSPILTKVRAYTVLTIVLILYVHLYMNCSVPCTVCVQGLYTLLYVCLHWNTFCTCTCTSISS